MKNLLRSILVITFLFFSIGAFAHDKVVVVPLSSTLKAIINPKEIKNHHVVVGPSGNAVIAVPADSTYVLTDLIGTNHLTITIHVNDILLLDLSTMPVTEKKLSMTSGISCPPNSSIKITNTIGTVTAVTLSGYYY